MFSLVIIALWGIAGAFFSSNISNQFQSVKESLKDIKGRIDKLDARVSGLHYPTFEKKAALVGLPVSLREFRNLQAKAEEAGLTNPVLTPVRLDAGFTIDAEGRLADGTPYKLIYRLEKIVGQEALLVLKRRERSRKLRGRCRDIRHEQEDYPEPLYCVRNEVRDLVFAQTAALISSALVTSEVKIV